MDGCTPHSILERVISNEPDPFVYEVSIEISPAYKIYGDTVMLDYYNQLYEEYVTPIVEKEMNGIPFIILVESEMILLVSQYGAEYEAVIPSSLDNENSIFEKRCFVFNIYIPKNLIMGKYPKFALISKKFDKR